MLPVRVLALPSLLGPDDLRGRTAVVFDVLRATSTIAAALSAGADAVRVFGSLDDARAAAAAFAGDKILAGEEHTLRPADFDLGNSPADFTADRCRGRTVLMATTNGTRALVAARSAAVPLTGAIVNAAATAAAVRHAGLPVTLIGSGTQGEVSLEDLVGCGAVMDALGDVMAENDTAVFARTLWRDARANLPHVFGQTFSARNLGRAGLTSDIADCCGLNRFDIACRVTDEAGGLVVRRWPR